MLGNDYLNLYQSDFYREKVEFFNSNNDTKSLNEFEQRFSLANALYTESKNCIGVNNYIMVVLQNSDIITAILSSDQSIFEILRDAADTERTVRPSETMTYLQAAVTVCKDHLEKIKKSNTGMHR